MKILAFNGSPRVSSSSTRQLLLAACEGAEGAGATTTVIDIGELDIGYCNGCGSCHITGECVLDDDFEAVYYQFLNADGIIFSSPVYINSVTAQLKTVFDRLSDAVHCQRLSGKYGCSLSTAGGALAEEVAEYQNGVIRMLGGTTVGSLGVNIMGDPAAVDAAIPAATALGADLAAAIREQRTYPEQEEERRIRREHMIELVRSNKNEWKSEYEYWENQGAYSDR
ncbi:MAG: Iron-sulfur flavoprotein [Methanomicrobiales archaeon 53_19]|jgi:multimeric flavodoxin WrbA|uniref:flavodoxin family protein n=1 Tax=Methanocalculus sp. TaxID=2004547 RepID=UPI0007497E40|nr:NAD(P)H-dependent oxidoreductase [Methanocalculus sp.]KUK71468.1 MAG: Iron-sulfur flavoprotein [Methanocalculus sp. 52_23]KUL04090.1 MAG: Iron-sulfur flavoprotein [Methanomicrobiales archaeon 53_19]HIJ07412.1 flavodoxin family protein [Methanocalculus sp.]